MTRHLTPITRRTLLNSAMMTAAGLMLGPTAWPASRRQPLMSTIPSTGERIPKVGLGSWITFNVGNDPKLLDDRATVMAAFFEDGGAMIDSSPMYGSSQDTIGYGLDKLGYPPGLISAEKVWTPDTSRTREQIAQSRKEWGVPTFDLMQVHNLVGWQGHLKTLFRMQAEGDLRYVGITTSHGRRHREVETVMRQESLDFIQVSYNILNREVEDRILPLARERGIAVIANRPFQQDRLTQWLEGKPLPDWARDIEARSWAQVLLKFIISHPDITCAIPATTRVDHVRENLAAASEPLPDAELRERMARYVRNLR